MGLGPVRDLPFLSSLFSSFLFSLCDNTMTIETKELSGDTDANFLSLNAKEIQQYEDLSFFLFFRFFYFLFLLPFVYFYLLFRIS